MNETIAVFAAVSAILGAAHAVGDHWIQHQADSDAKGLPGWIGRLACVKHVATYTATAVIGLGLAHLYLDLSTEPVPTAIGLGVSAVSHYIADRREPLRRIANALGKQDFYRLKSFGMNGAYLLDQSWHAGYLVWAALIIAGGTDRLALTALLAVTVTAFLGYKVARAEQRSGRLAEQVAPVSPAVATPVRQEVEV
ncbi:hypothetical protein [Glycomyces buryatensis]|uniref:hypothetical protein n=1 Tax=Glycomyces buryatensis TaxID=2570927 RepID=UPI001B3C14F5|nr:hypothetical protein [Glycomyces buryatensis]